MIMQRGHAKSVVERDGHHGIHFVLEENGVAHHHCAIFCFSERRPGAEAHERRHGPAIDGDFHVVARKSDFVDVFLLVKLAFEAGNRVDLCGVERGRCRGDRGAAKGRC